MKVLEALKNAGPLDKARVFSILGSPEFYKGKVDRRYIENAEELLEDFRLEKYQREIISELEKGKKPNEWEKKIAPVKKQYEKELIKDYIIENMDSYDYLDEVESKRLVEWAEILAAYLVGVGLKTNQIRKFLDGVRKVEANIKMNDPKKFSLRDVLLLKVHLAYAKGRQESVKALMLVMDKAIDKIREGEEGFRDFDCFVKFVEAVVAYHKFYGGKD